MQTRHKLLIGPPGTGKIIYARDLARSKNREFVQSKMSSEFARIYRVAGMNHGRSPLKAPFRAPHHTVSATAIRGQLLGGWCPQAGEISLAHGGILFLDNVTEFSAAALDAVRCGIANTSAHLTGRTSSIKIPADFTLVAAMSPCPCGWHGAEPSSKGQSCTCTQAQITKYSARVPQWITDYSVLGPSEYAATKP